MIIGDRLQRSVDSYSGASTFALDLVTVPGRNGLGIRIPLAYMGRVEQPASTWNLDAPTGLAGLGWHLPVQRIVAVPNGVAAYGAPTYFLIGNGGANRLLQNGVDGLKRTFTLENWLPWRITYEPASERWEVIDENGVLSVFGDLSIGGSPEEVVKLPSRYTVEFNVRWENWIGSTNQILGQRRFVTVWNLAAVSDRYGDAVVWYYENVEVATATSQGLAFTAASYPKRVVGSDGSSVIFNYEEKTAAEVQQPHTNPPPPNAWQDRIETRFLKSVDVLAANGAPLYSEVLDYGAPTFLGSGALTKRLLLGINRTHAAGGSLPGVKFEYWGQNGGDGVSATNLFNAANGALYGAIKRATLPEGGTYSWEYQSLTPVQSQRSAAIARPVLAGVTFSKPRVVFNDAYTAVTWLGTGSQTVMAVQAFTWDGWWIPSPVVTFTIPSSAAYDAALLTSGATSFAVYVNAQLHLYALDESRAGALIQGQYSPAFDGGETPLLSSGDGFAAMVGSISGKLYRYRFDGVAWQADALVTLSAGGTPAVFTINARRNVLTAAGIRSGATGAPLFLTIFRRDGTGAWVQSVQFQTALALAPVDSISLFGGDTFVVYRGVRDTGANQQVKSGVVVWNALTSAITNQAFDTLVLATGAAIPTPAIDQSLVAVGQMTYRYDGTQWIRFDVGTITYPNQQAVEAVGVATDVVVRRIRTGASLWVDDLVDFDPNTGTWSNPAAISVSTAAQAAVAAPRRGAPSNFAVVGGTIRYHSWTGVWNDTLIGLAGISSATDLDSVQLLPDFILYQTGSDSRLFFLANGTATSGTPLVLTGEQFLVTGQPAEMLVGTSAFITYTGTWDTPASVLTLHRAVGAAVNGAQLTYATRRVTGNNGYPPGDLPSVFPTGYLFDVTAATMEPGGVLPQFNVAKMLPGDDEASYGSQVTAYFNGLPPNVPPLIAYPVDGASANAQSLYSLAKGLVYKAQNRLSSTIDTASSLTRYQWIIANLVASCGIAFYARSRKIEDALDGVITTTTTEYSTDTGLVVRTSRDNTDIDGRLQYYKRELTYFWEKYDPTRALNILTPIVQQIDKTQTPSVGPADVVTANQVTTWKSDWGSGSGQWSPYKVFAARTADAPPFNAWQPTDPDPSGWLRVTTATARNSSGGMLRSSGIDGQPMSAGWDNSGTHLVWLDVNGDDAIDEVAYFGCEPYELTWGWTWSDPTASIWDFITTADYHTGTQSIYLPPLPGVKTGPTRVFQPGTQHRRFLFSAWAKRDNGFDVANGRAYIEIAVRDVTSNEWLTPVTIEITSHPGLWDYIQRVLDLDVLRGGKPATDVLALHITAYDQNTTTRCYVDELRFAPLDSSFRAAVYDPTRFDVTAAIAQNGQNNTTLYDKYARPIASIGPLGRVHSVLSASYSRSLTTADAFLPSYPNSTLQLATSSFSRYYDFHDGSTADWTFSDPSQWSIASAALRHTGTSSAPLGSTAILKIVAFRNFAARIVVRPGTPAPTTIALGNNDVFMRWNGSQWQLVRLANNVVTVLAVSSFQGFRGEWIYVVVDGFILAYVDGVQIFCYTYIYPTTPPPDWGKVTLAVSGDCDFDDLVVMQEPQLSLSFSDGLGRTMQTIALQGRAIDGPYANQYPTASNGTFYDALGRAQFARIDLTAPVAIAAPPPLEGQERDDTAAALVVANQSTYLRTTDGRPLTVRQFLDGDGGYQYQQLTYEQSPLSRITRTVPPRPTAADAALAAADVQYDGAFVATQWLPLHGSPSPGGYFHAQSVTFEQTLQSEAATLRYQTISDRLGRTVTVMQGPAAGNPNTIGYVYDDAGRLAAIRPPNYYAPPAGSTAASWVETREYTFLGPITKVTTPDSGATQFLHDDSGRLRFELNAAGAALTPQQIQYLKYDSLGRAIETGYIQDSNYLWGSAALNAKINVPQFPIVDPASSGDPNYAAGQWRKQFIWDYLADPSALYVAGALAQVLLNSGDAANPDSEKYTYDAFGNVIKTVSTVRQFDAAKEWTFLYDYDSQSRIALITYPVMDAELPFKVGYSYDRLGRLAAIGQAINPGDIVDPDNPPPIPEKYYSDITYSPNGWIAAETLNNGAGRPRIARSYSYSKAGALTSIADPYTTEDVGWDGGGVMPSGTDFFSGLVASDAFDYHAGPKWADPPAAYSYANANDPTGELLTAANSLDANWSQTMGAAGVAPYDPNGNILATSRGLTVSTYNYTSGNSRTNRLDHVTSAASDQLSFSNVPVGSTTFQGWTWGSNNGGPSTSFINTSQSHSGTQSLQLGGGSLAHYERLAFAAYLPPAGTLTITCWVKTATGFDAAPGEAAWYLALTGTRGEILEVRLGQVPAGAANWTQMTVTRDIATLRDQLGIGRDVQLASVELRNYKRGTNGSGPYVLLDDISLNATATGSYVYDLAGRMTQSTARRISAVAYDPVSSLPRTITTTGTGASTTNLTYNAFDTRALEVVTAGAATLKTLQLRGIAGAPLVTRTTGASGTVTTYWIAGPGGIFAYQRGGAISYVMQDHLGSTRLVVDGETGMAGDSIDYLPFGEVMRESGTSPIDYLFTGQERDAATGLYNYNARMYDPAVGRFLQPDAAKQFPTPYSYVGSEPFGRVDPSGRNAIVLIRSTKSETYFDTPDTGHAGVLVNDPSDPGLWIFRDIVPRGSHAPLACAEAIYNVYWFNIYDAASNGTEPNYPSNAIRQSSLEKSFYTKSDLIKHLTYTFPRFSRRPDAVVEVALTPDQDRQLIDQYERIIAARTEYCTLGLNCAGFVEAGFRPLGLPRVQKESSWLFGPLLLPAWLALGGDPLAGIKTPNSLYRSLAASGLNVTYHKDLEETRYNTITSSSLGSNLIFVPIGYAAGIGALALLNYFSPRARGITTGVLSSFLRCGAGLVGAIAANPAAFTFLLLPQPAGNPQEDDDDQQQQQIAGALELQLQPTPGFLMGGDPEKQVIFAEPGSQVRHVVTLTLGTLTAPPAVFNSFAYAGEGNTTAGSLLHSWSLTTSVDAWNNMAIAASVDATPIIQAGMMYVAAANGFLYAYDISGSGNPPMIWQLDVMGLTAGTKKKTTALILSASGNIVYLVSEGGIWAANIDLRSVLWHASQTLSFTQAVPYYDGRTLLASSGSSLYAIDTTAPPSGGVLTPKWTFNAGATCNAPFLIAGAFAVIDGTGKLHALDPETGVETASLANVIPPSATATSSVYEDVILAANTGGDLYARRVIVSGGALKLVELWKVSTPAPIYGAPIAFGGYVYVSPMGKLQAYRLRDAALVWTTAAPSNISRLGPLSLGLRIPQGTAAVKFLLDGPEFFLTLRNLLLAVAAGTFNTTTPATTLTAEQLLTNIGASGGNSYLMLWDTTDTKQFLRANYLGPLLDLAGKVDSRENLRSVRTIDGTKGVQAILVPYKAFDSWQPLYSQHQKIGIFSVGGTKLAFVGGFNLDLPLYWDETTHPMLGTGGDGKKNYATWHDSALLLQGAAADLVEQHYDRIWKATGRPLNAPATANYAKLGFWAGKSSSCVDKFESCSGAQPPSPYVNPSLSTPAINVDLLITNGQTSERVTDIRARLVQRIKTANSYVYMENYAVNDIELIRAISGKLRNAPAGFQIILMTPHPTKGDDGDEQVAENVLTKMGYAAIFLDTQQWTSFTTTANETITKANITDFKVIYDDRGPEYGTLSFVSGGSTRTLSFSAVQNIATPAGVQPGIIFCSAARYVQDVQPGEEKYELTGGVLSTHFRKVYIHSKLALFDDTSAIIGSANLTERSLYRDGETNVCVTDAATVNAMRTKLFAHWGQTTVQQWYATMNAFAGATTPALGVVPLTFAALPNDWPNWQWAWAASITGMSDYI